MVRYEAGLFACASAFFETYNMHPILHAKNLLLLRSISKHARKYRETK